MEKRNINNLTGLIAYVAYSEDENEKWVEPSYGIQAIREGLVVNPDWLQHYYHYPKVQLQSQAPVLGTMLYLMPVQRIVWVRDSGHDVIALNTIVKSVYQLDLSYRQWQFAKSSLVEIESLVGKLKTTTDSFAVAQATNPSLFADISNTDFLSTNVYQNIGNMGTLRDRLIDSTKDLLVAINTRIGQLRDMGIVWVDDMPSADNKIGMINWAIDFYTAEGFPKSG